MFFINVNVTDAVERVPRQKNFIEHEKSREDEDSEMVHGARLSLIFGIGRLDLEDRQIDSDSARREFRR